MTTFVFEIGERVLVDGLLGTVTAREVKEYPGRIVRSYRVKIPENPRQKARAEKNPEHEGFWYDENLVESP